MSQLHKLLLPVKGFLLKQNKQDDCQGYDPDDAIDRVIDGIDSRLRLVPGYRAQLLPAVQRSLDYISTLVDQVPGPLDMSRKNFVSNPEVRAYFATPDSLQSVFSCGSEVRTFFSEHQNATHCYALLCADKQVKQHVGSAMVNNKVQRDVMQQSISFYDHKLMSPASNEAGVRQGIKECIFDGLITYTLQQIAAIKNERRELQNQRRILHAQLRVRQNQGGGLSALLMQAQQQQDQTTPQIARQLSEAEHRLEAMLEKKDVLRFYLNEIVSLLDCPEAFITLQVACLKLNDMGVLMQPDATSASTVCFSELDISNVLKRVVTIVRYHKADLDCKQNSDMHY